MTPTSNMPSSNPINAQTAEALPSTLSAPNVAAQTDQLAGKPPLARRVVLAGTDMTDSSDEALRQGWRSSVERHDRLVACYVAPAIHAHLLVPEESQPLPDVLAQRAAKLAELDARVARVTGAPAGAYDVLIEEGVADEVLVRLADDLAADLLVVGSASGSVLGRLFGGVAERVVRHAHAPVLVARATHNIGRVLVATDFSDPSLPAVEAAVAEAKRRSAELHIVHVVHMAVPPVMPFMPGAVTPMIEAEQRADGDHMRAAEARMFDALARFAASGVHHVVEGSPGPEILELVKQLQPELLIVGTAGKTGIRRLVLGSVAEYVVAHAALPTLVVRLHPDDKATASASQKE